MGGYTSKLGGYRDIERFVVDGSGVVVVNESRGMVECGWGVVYNGSGVEEKCDIVGKECGCW